MAYAIRWTEPAESDLRDIAAYISRDSTANAASVVTDIVHSADRLRDFPFSGRVIEHYKDTYLREIIVHDFRVMYRIFPDDCVEIRRLIHSRRKFRPRKERRWLF